MLGLLVALAVTPPLSSPALERLVELEERELGVKLRRRFSLVTRHPGAILGFGAGCALLFMAPRFGVLLLPVGVVGATELVWRLLDADPTLMPELQRHDDGSA